MTLKLQIEKDFIESYKAKEERKVSLLRMIKSSIKNTEINEKRELNDSDIYKILKKEIKQRTDAIGQYQKGNRPELAAKEASEIEMITTYLPKQLDDSELTKIVNETILEIGATEMKDMGRVISRVIEKVGDSAEGGKISGLVKAVLQK